MKRSTVLTVFRISAASTAAMWVYLMLTPPESTQKKSV